MRFLEYRTAYEVAEDVLASAGIDLKYDAGKRNPKDFYNWWLDYLSDRQPEVTHQLVVAMHQYSVEGQWYEAGRPFYDVYPGIAKYLTRLRMDVVNTSEIHLPVTYRGSNNGRPFESRCVEFRFREDDPNFVFEHAGETHRLRAVLAVDRIEAKRILNLKSTHPIAGDEKRRCLTMYMDFGETLNGFPLQVFRKVLMDDGMTMEEAVDALGTDKSVEEGIPIPEECTEAAVRLICASCLMAEGREESLIEPIVLSKDRIRFEQGDDELRSRLVDKARRRGRFGWSIGREMESVPHYRRGHVMVLKAGVAGRTRSRVVWRRGAVVHREKADKLPSGRLD